MKKYKQTYTPIWNDKSEEHNPNNYDNIYTSKCNDNLYTTRHKELPNNTYTYSKQKDKSGKSNYTDPQEERDIKLIKSINNYEIKCVYPINMNNYYKNVNIYNYKKKIII